jgi:hypothetical protein
MLDFVPGLQNEETVPIKKDRLKEMPSDSG